MRQHVKVSVPSKYRRGSYDRELMVPGITWGIVTAVTLIRSRSIGEEYRPKADEVDP